MELCHFESNLSTTNANANSNTEMNDAERLYLSFFPNEIVEGNDLESFQEQDLESENSISSSSSSFVTASEDGDLSNDSLESIIDSSSCKRQEEDSINQNQKENLKNQDFQDLILCTTAEDIYLLQLDSNGIQIASVLQGIGAHIDSQFTFYRGLNRKNFCIL